MEFPDGHSVDMDMTPDIVEYTVKQAIAATFKMLENPKGSSKKRLLEDTEELPIKLKLSVYRIPPIPPQKNKIIRIRLRHNPVPPSSGICLFVQDLKKNGRPDNDKVGIIYKDRLKLKGVEGITKIVTLDQLRKEYKTFESKRRLCHADDVFIADETIMAFLPRLLGREFWTKKKIPSKVNMKGKNLKEEFQKAIKTANLIVHGRGSTYSISLGYLGLGMQKIFENFMKAYAVLKKSLPGGWSNVKSLHLTSGDTYDMPLYLSDGSGGDIKFASSITQTRFTASEDLTTSRRRIKVHPRGRVQML